MSWDNQPTEKQIGALIVMARHCQNPYFTTEQVNDFVESLKDRKEASEALTDIRNARIYEDSSGLKGNKDGKWYQKLLKDTESERKAEHIERLEKLIAEHPNSAVMPLWERELKMLKEEK